MPQTTHPRDVIIDSMARTLLVEAYVQWVQAWDTARGWDPRKRAPMSQKDRPAAAVSARGGEDWFDVAPAGPAAFRAACRTEAAVLYGRIMQAWGAEPWLVLHWNGHDGSTRGGSAREDQRARWGHYAVMSAMGHGVSWEDSEEELHGPPPAKSAQFYTMHARGSEKINLDGMSWPGRWPEERA